MDRRTDALKISRPLSNSAVSTFAIPLPTMSSLMPVTSPLPSSHDSKTDIMLINPKPFLQELTGKHIIVKLKWGQEYHGRLNAVDSYMNLKLTNTEEWKDGKNEGMLGEVFIRCNNVLWISENAFDSDKMQQD